MPLGSHPNVYSTCLFIMETRGYALKVEGELDEDGCYPIDKLWLAEKGGFRFVAENPIELLGLIAIYDQIQPKADISYWWKLEGRYIYDRLMAEAFPVAE